MPGRPTVAPEGAEYGKFTEEDYDALLDIGRRIYEGEYGNRVQITYDKDGNPPSFERLRETRNGREVYEDIIAITDKYPEDWFIDPEWDADCARETGLKTVYLGYENTYMQPLVEKQEEEEYFARMKEYNDSHPQIPATISNDVGQPWYFKTTNGIEPYIRNEYLRNHTETRPPEFDDASARRMELRREGDKEGGDKALYDVLLKASDEYRAEHGYAPITVEKIDYTVDDGKIYNSYDEYLATGREWKSDQPERVELDRPEMENYKVGEPPDFNVYLKQPDIYGLRDDEKFTQEELKELYEANATEFEEGTVYIRPDGSTYTDLDIIIGERNAATEAKMKDIESYYREHPDELPEGGLDAVFEEMGLVLQDDVFYGSGKLSDIIQDFEDITEVDTYTDDLESSEHENESSIDTNEPNDISSVTEANTDESDIDSEDDSDTANDMDAEEQETEQDTVDAEQETEGSEQDTEQEENDTTDNATGERESDSSDRTEKDGETDNTDNSNSVINDDKPPETDKDSKKNDNDNERNDADMPDNPYFNDVGSDNPLFDEADTGVFTDEDSIVEVSQDEIVGTTADVVRAAFEGDEVAEGIINDYLHHDDSISDADAYALMQDRLEDYVNGMRENDVAREDVSQDNNTSETNTDNENRSNEGQTDNTSSYEQKYNAHTEWLNNDKGTIRLRSDTFREYHRMAQTYNAYKGGVEVNGKVPTKMDVCVSVINFYRSNIVESLIIAAFRKVFDIEKPVNDVERTETPQKDVDFGKSDSVGSHDSGYVDHNPDFSPVEMHESTYNVGKAFNSEAGKFYGADMTKGVEKGSTENCVIRTTNPEHVNGRGVERVSGVTAEKMTFPDVRMVEISGNRVLVDPFGKILDRFEKFSVEPNFNGQNGFLQGLDVSRGRATSAFIENAAKAENMTVEQYKDSISKESISRFCDRVESSFKPEMDTLKERVTLSNIESGQFSARRDTIELFEPIADKIGGSPALAENCKIAVSELNVEIRARADATSAVEHRIVDLQNKVDAVAKEQRNPQSVSLESRFARAVESEKNAVGRSFERLEAIGSDPQKYREFADRAGDTVEKLTNTVSEFRGVQRGDKQESVTFDKDTGKLIDAFGLTHKGQFAYLGNKDGFLERTKDTQFQNGVDASDGPKGNLREYADKYFDEKNTDINVMIDDFKEATGRDFVDGQQKEFMDDPLHDFDADKFMEELGLDSNVKLELDENAPEVELRENDLDPVVEQEEVNEDIARDDRTPEVEAGDENQIEKPEDPKDMIEGERPETERPENEKPEVERPEGEGEVERQEKDNADNEDESDKVTRDGDESDKADRPEQDSSDNENNNDTENAGVEKEGEDVENNPAELTEQPQEPEEVEEVKEPETPEVETPEGDNVDAGKEAEEETDKSVSTEENADVDNSGNEVETDGDDEKGDDVEALADEEDEKDSSTNEEEDKTDTERESSDDTTREREDNRNDVESESDRTDNAGNDDVGNSDNANNVDNADNEGREPESESPVAKEDKDDVVIVAEETDDVDVVEDESGGESAIETENAFANAGVDARDAATGNDDNSDKEGFADKVKDLFSDMFDYTRDDDANTLFDDLSSSFFDRVDANLEALGDLIDGLSEATSFSDIIEVFADAYIEGFEKQLEPYMEIWDAFKESSIGQTLSEIGEGLVGRISEIFGPEVGCEMANQVAETLEVTVDPEVANIIETSVENAIQGFNDIEAGNVEFDGLEVSDGALCDGISGDTDVGGFFSDDMAQTALDEGIQEVEQEVRDVDLNTMPDDTDRFHEDVSMDNANGVDNGMENNNLDTGVDNGLDNSMDTGVDNDMNNDVDMDNLGGDVGGEAAEDAEAAEGIEAILFI